MTMEEKQPSAHPDSPEMPEKITTVHGKKAATPIIILILAVTALLVGTVIFLLTKNTNPSPIPSASTGLQATSIPDTTTPTIPASTTSPTATVSSGLLIYKNTKYGFEISYPKTYKALDSADDLSGYPNGAVLIYNGGQAYDIVIEVWNTKTEYENKFGAMIKDVTVKESNGKFITIQNATDEPENAQIIASFKLISN